jgi:F-type H+-transporting ATPase subunit delta
MQESVQAGLSRMYGPGLSTSFTESPVLIGGMRIQVGSDVYDGSIQAKLAALEARF